MKLRHACKEDFPALKELWSLCFGDDPAYIDLFFEDLFSPEHSYVLALEERPVSMIFSIPTTLRTPEGCHSAVYLYAMATHPDQQGRGLGLKLMDYVAQCCRERQVQVIALKPADEKLFYFYGKAGYHNAFYCRTRTGYVADAPKGKVTPVSPEQYLNLRREFLTAIPHMEFHLPFLTHQARIGGRLLALEWGKHRGCAVVEETEDGWVAKELLVPKRTERQALGLLAQMLGVDQVTGRYPARNGAPFGVMLWTQDPRPLRGWLGLALD